MWDDRDLTWVLEGTRVGRLASQVRIKETTSEYITLFTQATTAIRIA